MYYLRSRPAADAIQFTVDMEALLKDAGEDIHIEGLIKDKTISNNNTIENENENINNSNVGSAKKKQVLPKCTMQEGCLSCGS